MRLNLKRLGPALLIAAIAAGGAYWAQGTGIGTGPAIGLVALGVFAASVVFLVPETAHTVPAATAPEDGSDLPDPDKNADSEAIAAKADRVSAVINAVPLAIVIVDRDQTIRHTNDGARALFGLPRAVGQPVETLRASKLLDAVQDAAHNDNSVVFDLTVSRSSDSFLTAHVAPLPYDDTEPRSVFIAIADETSARLADELHRDFVANASHELKTPLAIVSGIIETLQGPARGDPAATDRFMGGLSVQVHRMTRLINDLMSLNRIELNERQSPDGSVALDTLLAELVDTMRPVADASDVELDVDAGKRRVIVSADRDELGQLFGNLLDNAIKYGGIGKRVHVSLAVPSGEGHAVVAVRDEGPGIAREHIPRLTERFYRVDVGRSREQGGTGLGLAICKHIANRHRGRIEIDSHPGEGTTFSVWLPLAEDSDLEPVPVPRTVASAESTAK